MTDVTQGAEQSASAAVVANAMQGGDQQESQTQQTQQTQQTNGQTIATGAETAETEVKAYWPADWREKIAEHASAGDKKAYEKELRRLQNMENPYSVYGSFRSMENTWASKGFIKLPPKEGAKPEEIAEFHKSLGVPEKPEEYLNDLKLENGVVFGEADKPGLEWFANAAHKRGVPKEAFAGLASEYLALQERQAAELDERDETFRIEAERALKEEYGPAFKRKTNAIASVFDIAPGGIDIKNESSLYARLMGGRMADGKMIGNDPDMVRFLVALAMDRNPAASVIEDGDAGGRSITDEITAIEKRMREDRAGYFKDERAQARYRELLEARDKIQTRSRG
jgi:hypothetical protein